MVRAKSCGQNTAKRGGCPQLLITRELEESSQEARRWDLAATVDEGAEPITNHGSTEKLASQ